MSHTTVGSYLTIIALCLAAGAVVPASVRAQTLPRAAFAPYLPDARTDSMLVLVELRDLAAIEFDRDVATTKRSAAETREAEARIFQSRAATTIKVKETEIAALKAKIKQTKAERDDARTKQLEGERRLAEVERQLLKRREQLRQSDIGLAKAEVEYHAAEMKACEAELELARMRARRTSIEGNIPSQEQFKAAWQLDKQIREMEGKTLDAKRETSHKQKNLAEHAVKIFKARKKVWEAQGDLINSAAGTN